MRAFVAEHGFAPVRVSPLAIANTARVLDLDRKGRLERGRDADALSCAVTRSRSRMSSRLENGWFATEGLSSRKNFKTPNACLRESAGAPSTGGFQTQLDLNQSPGLHFLSGLAYDFSRSATKCHEAMFVGAPKDITAS
jgi:adenine deaminase